MDDRPEGEIDERKSLKNRWLTFIAATWFKLLCVYRSGGVAEAECPVLSHREIAAPANFNRAGETLRSTPYHALTNLRSNKMSESNRIERPHSEALDRVIGHAFPVLDNGFVRVVDYLGNDSSIVQAARVSYGSGTKHVREDRGLIRYLMRHSHTTPFEMCELKLHVRVPMDCWRQWIRHRTANVNEYSTRYSVAIDANQATPTSKWRRQSTVNRQGSDIFIDLDTGTHLSRRERDLHLLADEVYRERLQLGVAREQARKDLPLSTYTEAYWKIDLHNLLHFLRLRMDTHAQVEIREYATVIANEIVAIWCPLTWEAFLHYHQNSLKLTAIETTIVEAIVMGNAANAVRMATEHGWLDEFGAILASGERVEAEQKLVRLGVPIPWKN